MRKEDKETRRKGDKEKRSAARLRSALLVSLSPLLLVFVQSPLLFVCSHAARGEPPSVADQPALLIAFSSLRDRPAFASLYVYRHDGIADGRLIAEVPPAFERGDTHPSLTADGSLCLYTSKQVGGFTPLLQFFDLARREVLNGPEFNRNFAARTEASLSDKGDLIALCVWDKPGELGGWDVILFDRKAAKFVELPGLNSEHNEREVTISGDGRYLAFISDRPESEGLSDICLYDRDARQVMPLPGLNSSHRELNPALSHDGKLLAFVSDRPGGAGGKDIYLYDRQTGAVQAPSGINSIGHEQTPAFSPDGRFVVFVSERTSGPGERDIYLYDRVLTRLVPTPGLNSTAEDFDPCLAFEPR
jgi:hypothetical protein